MAAALVHDLGHGPFSHAFEDAAAKLGAKKKHEDWTAEIVRGDTQVGKRLAAYGEQFRADVAELLASETPRDLYAAIVASQFDADRLDYMRRDRLMTGAQHGGFDCPWLLANLEVDRIAYLRDEEQYAEVDGLVLGNKAFQAAEEYVLGFVYFHKATRSAEKDAQRIIKGLGDL
jgi:HD superfamily phosphohydrolase